jgi:hypothetical protein
MKEERFETGKAPQLLVQCRSDLHVSGWAEPAVLAAGDLFETSEGNDGLFIDGKGDLNLMVPSATTVNVLQSGGDLAIKSVAGDITITEVSGDAQLRNLGKVAILAVQGDLSCRDINDKLTLDKLSGDAGLRNTQDLELNVIGGDIAAVFVNGAVAITSAMGDVSLKTVNGDVNVDSAQRDVNVRNVGGMVSVKSVQGDIRLRGGLGAGKHTMFAQGDIVVRWPLEAPLNLEATASHIQRRMDMLDLVEEENFLSGRIGDGECFLILEAKGRIILKDIPVKDDSWRGYDKGSVDFDLDFDISGIGERIATEVSSRMSDWSSRFDREFGPEFAARIDRASQQAAARAERAARKAEKAIRKVRWHTEPDAWTAASTPRSSTSTKERAATAEEQLKILRMVENGIISPEEASTLLEAIEG